MKELSLENLAEILEGKKILAYDPDLAISYLGTFTKESDPSKWRLVVWKASETEEIVKVFVAVILNGKARLSEISLRNVLTFWRGKESMLKDLLR